MADEITGFVLGDIDVAHVEAVARLHAAALGLRPRTRVTYFSSWERFRHYSVDALAQRHNELRGMCARGGEPGQRFVWVAPHGTLHELLETLTHEVAHALTPWRERHTPRWLQLHLATLAALTSPQHAADVARICAMQHDLPEQAST